MKPARIHILKRRISFVLILSGLLAAHGCSDQDFAADGLQSDLFSFFDFNQGQQGWEAGFAKYPEGAEGQLALESQRCAFPVSSGLEGSAMCLSGRNPQEDLFYFVKRQIEGLAPNTTYILDFQLQFVTEVIEPSRANDMYVLVKVGASDIEPTLSPANDLSERGYRPVVLNIDVGSGEMLKSANAVPIGELDLSGPGNTRTFHASSARQAFTGTSDQDGKLWLIVGFDSYSDAYLAFYLQSIFVGYKKV